MSKTKLEKLLDIRIRKQESARRAYSAALAAYNQAERLHRMLKLRRVEFADAVAQRAREETQALVAQAAHAGSISAVHEAFERRQKALDQMDKDIELAAERKEACARQAETARIAYAEASKAEKKLAELVARETEEAARKAERLEEMSQDVTIRDKSTGRWTIRPTS